MRSLVDWWKNVSIAKRLYGVFGVMMVLIALELLTLRFAMDTLSAVRAFVGGEGLWSKAQKNATIALHSYAITKDEKDYQAFLGHLKISEGDHIARIEISKPKPNMEIVRQGFLQGQIPDEDIAPMARLLLRFYWVSYLSQAIQDWTEADMNMDKFKQAGARYHALVQSKTSSEEESAKVFREILELNDRLTEVEGHFSKILGEGSRWLEHVIISLLFMAVLTVESIGLFLTFITSRAISRGLAEISSTAEAIGHGQFHQKVIVNSNDEIGVLGKCVNSMGEMLEGSYRELEKRVAERTVELAHAVKARDEFLSIASHELKTPLTVLQLQTQIRKRLVQKRDPNLNMPETLMRMWEGDEKHIMRLVHLIDDMLDISRLNNGKLLLNCMKTNLTQLVTEVVDRMAPNFSAAGCTVSMDLEPSLYGHWDSFRLEQMLTNLLTNAMKYSPGRPVHISLHQKESEVVLSVQDHGIGIAKQDQERIFGRFERASMDTHVSGFGVGLYIVKEIVEAHGGHVWVESEPGKGANFSVALKKTA